MDGEDPTWVRFWLPWVRLPLSNYAALWGVVVDDFSIGTGLPSLTPHNLQLHITDIGLNRFAVV